MTIDFGLVPMVSVGSSVWADNDNDGIYDSDELPLEGITVHLYEDTDMDGIPDGPPVATVLTDMDGNYLFDSLLVGSYIIGVEPSADYPLSSELTSGESDDGVDNNDNGIQENPGDVILSTMLLTTTMAI